MMNKMKRIILLMAFVFAASGVGAQGIARVREALARPDAFSRARVEVKEQPDAARAISLADHTHRLAKVTAYRVSLFRDNSQVAGENARAVEAQFEEMYPEIAAEVSYESPYFKVTAGNYLDRTSALALWGKVLPHFPKAVVVQEEAETAVIILPDDEEKKLGDER